MLDLALIQDVTRLATLLCAKSVGARHEVFVGDIQAGHKQATNIDLRSLAEYDARRIDQEHLTIGSDTAQNLVGLPLITRFSAVALEFG